jgi:hypothetical protein
MKNKHSNFLGTYFNIEAVLRLVQALKIIAWIILFIFGFQLILTLGVDTLQLLRGFWTGMGFTDIVQNYLSAFGQPLLGVVYFGVLLGIAQLLLICLDIEDNTRRAARETQK